MKTKTADLIDLALDWMVAVAEGATRIQLYEYNGRRMIRVSLLEGIHAPWEPSRYWGQGGSLIEQERIELFKGNPILFVDGTREALWIAKHQSVADRRPNGVHGPTPLIAAMRCFVASRLGDEVDIPEELLK